MEEKYDSTEDTERHIGLVQNNLDMFIVRLKMRARVHDASKLEEPEKSLFDEWTPKLSAMEYGSAEYKEALASMGPALEHHYHENKHHPEHWMQGIVDMNLLDIMEMLADWKAAQERVKDGSMEHSLKVNFKRFKISSDVAQVIANTAADMGWIEHR